MTVAKEKYTDLNNGRGMFKGVTNKRTAAIILLSFMFLSLFSIILSSILLDKYITLTIILKLKTNNVTTNNVNKFFKFFHYLNFYSQMFNVWVGCDFIYILTV